MEVRCRSYGAWRFDYVNQLRRCRAAGAMVGVRTATASAGPAAARGEWQGFGESRPALLPGRAAAGTSTQPRSGKAAVNAPHSRRFARFEGPGLSRQRLECGGFSTASVGNSSTQRRNNTTAPRNYPEGIASFSPALPRRRSGNAGWRIENGNQRRGGSKKCARKADATPLPLETIH